MCQSGVRECDHVGLCRHLRRRRHVVLVHGSALRDEHVRDGGELRVHHHDPDLQRLLQPGVGPADGGEPDGGDDGQLPRVVDVGVDPGPL